MTKADLSAEVSAAAKIPRDQSEVLVEAIFESILRFLFRKL
jgi:nucleoid DNA-binding protein